MGRIYRLRIGECDPDETFYNIAHLHKPTELTTSTSVTRNETR